MKELLNLLTISQLIKEPILDEETLDKIIHSLLAYLTKHKDRLKDNFNELESFVLLSSNYLTHDSLNKLTAKHEKLVITLSEELKKKNKIWPELSLVNNPVCQKNYKELITSCLTLFATVKEAPKVITQLAPRFYDSADKRQFNRKFEDQKLKDKQKRLRKKIANEIAEETDLLLNKEKRKQDQINFQKNKKMKRVMNDLYKQKREIERENTSNVHIKRIKKKRKRQAGSKGV